MRINVVHAKMNGDGDSIDNILFFSAFQGRYTLGSTTGNDELVGCCCTKRGNLSQISMLLSYRASLKLSVDPLTPDASCCGKQKVAVFRDRLSEKETYTYYIFLALDESLWLPSE